MKKTSKIILLKLEKKSPITDKITTTTTNGAEVATNKEVSTFSEEASIETKIDMKIATIMTSPIEEKEVDTLCREPAAEETVVVVAAVVIIKNPVSMNPKKLMKIR